MIAAIVVRRQRATRKRNCRATDAKFAVMKRVFAAVLFCAAFVAFAHARAQAMIEFCPARLHLAPVAPGAPSVRAQMAVYGFNLEAMGPRSVSATLAFDTDMGWFKADVPEVVLTAKKRRFTSNSVSFTRTDYVSPVMYVRFPRAVAIQHTWVYSATTKNDGPFGWAPQGTVTCDTPVGADAAGDRSVQPGDFPQMNPNDGDNLNLPPGPDSVIVLAQETPALESTACAEPFRNAVATSVSKVDFAPTLMGRGRTTSSILVAIDAAGSVIDAWVWGPTGSEMADDLAIAGAKATKYRAGRAYCRDVPGLYMFRVTFEAPQ